MPDFAISKHAVERILDMAIEPDEIRDAFERPRNEHQSEQTGAYYLTRGRISLVVSYDTPVPTVITVLWASPNAWSADSGRGKYGEAGLDMASSRAAFKARRRTRGTR